MPLQSESFYSSDGYLGLSATDKLSYLWSEITHDSTPSSYPSSAAFAGFFAESMEPTFSTKGDAMAPGSLYGHRTKYIHCVGGVAIVSFNSNGWHHPFTGLFKGANHGILRLSSATKPELGTDSPLFPSIGLKFLRDGIDSANLVANRLKSQPGNWNYFY